MGSESTRGSIFTLRWIAFAFLAWTVLAAIPTSSGYIAEGSRGLARWLQIFGNIAPYYYLWALLTPAIYWLSTHILHPSKGWAAAIAGHAVNAAVLTFAIGFVVQFSHWRDWLLGVHAAGFYAMSAFSYIFILLGIYLFSLQQRVRRQDALIAEHRQRQLELESSLARAQVDMLRGQMNPHFLFNALNCIGALIETGRNDRAYEALEDLGGLLRTSLEHRDHELVPLREELAFAQRYIAMEKVRFGERLQLDTRLDSAAAAWMVPPFILQPLIENSVKHAVAPSHEAVTVSISGRRDGNALSLEVSDNGSGSNSGRQSSGTGVGLENLRKRLSLIYGEAAQLRFEQDESGTQVHLRIPDEIATMRRPKADKSPGEAAPHFGKAVLEGPG
jgi:two-component system LytT family sensor kinase